MGQRHQTFVKVLNPVKKERSYMSDEDRKRATKLFGRGKYTILVFHHGWLYGRMALYMANNILKVSNPETWNTYNNPFSPDYNFRSLDDYIDNITILTGCISDSDAPRGIGIEPHFMINDCDSEIRNDFTRGDNNDGITIIDTIDRKLCFMNIFTHGYDSNELSNDINDLVPLVPSTPEEYVKAYYVETKETANDYFFKDKTESQIKTQLIENKEANVKATVILDGYPTLTDKEVAKLFPRLKEDILNNKFKLAKTLIG